MNKEKQIEEMAKTYEEAKCKANVTLGSMNEGAAKWYAKAFYEAGYRKASEVAEEIFAEIEKRLDAITIVMGVLDSLRTFHKTIEAVTAEVDELKKKYTEVGK